MTPEQEKALREAPREAREGAVAFIEALLSAFRDWQAQERERTAQPAAPPVDTQTMSSTVVSIPNEEPPCQK